MGSKSIRLKIRLFSKSDFAIWSSNHRPTSSLGDDKHSSDVKYVVK